MPSGKKARQLRQQAAATPPPVRSTGGAGARQASPKVLAAAGGVVVLVAIAIVLAVVLGKSSPANNTGPGNGDSETVLIATGTPTVGSSKTSDLQGAADVAKLLDGIPQEGLVLGASTAPVTLIEYIGLQCPDCDQFEVTEFPTLVANYVRKGKLKIEMQPWSILDRTAAEHDSDRCQKATIAAAAQNKAFQFAQVLYDNQGTEGTNWMNDAMISRIAASVDGLHPYQLATDANSSATQSIIKTITDFANAHYNPNTGEMGGTPTIYLQTGSGKPQWFYTGVPDLGSLESAINARLK